MVAPRDKGTPSEAMLQPLPPELLQSGTGRYPVPDPTTLTTEALRREVNSLQVLIEQRLAALKELLYQKLEAVERELELRQVDRLAQHDALQELMELKTHALREELHASVSQADAITEEKFHTVEQNFDLVEKGRVEQKLDTKAAVDAALTAQKEAVREQTTASERAIAKSEASTNKQLEQQALTTTTAIETLRNAMDDIKNRLSDVEKELRASIVEVDKKANAGIEQKRGAGENRAGLYTALAAATGAIIVAIAIFNAIAR